MSKFFGTYVITDPQICHGQPTFRGTRILVRQVLDMVAQEMSWDEIVEQCHRSISKDAIAEAVTLANKAFSDHAAQHKMEAVPA